MSELKDTIHVCDVINLLNEVIELDQVAAQKLFDGGYIPCNDKLLNHDTIQCVDCGEIRGVRLLGILNGLFGTDPETGYGIIAGEFNDGGELIKFRKTDFDEIKLRLKKNRKGK